MSTNALVENATEMVPVALLNNHATGHISSKPTNMPTQSPQHSLHLPRVSSSNNQVITMNEQQSVALQRFVGATHAALYVHLTNVGGTFSVSEKTKYGYKFFSDWSYLNFEIKNNQLTFNLNTIPEYFEIVCGNQQPEPITYTPVNLDGSWFWKLATDSDPKLFSHDKIARHWYEKFLSHVVEHTNEEDLQSMEAA